MADSSQVLSGFQSFLQKKTGSRVINVLSDVAPTFDYLLRLAGHKQGPFGLGRPEAGDLAFGRINGISSPMREKFFRERVYEPIWKKTKPSDTNRIKKMAYRDNTVAVPHPGTGDSLVLERFIQPRFKLSRTQSAATVWHDDKRTAFRNATNPGQAAAAILSVFEVEDKDAEVLLVEDLNNELFGVNGKSGAPTSEDAKVWDSIYSIANALGTGNTYGGLDRTDPDNADWKGNVVTAQYSGTFRDLINHSNYKLYETLATHGSVGGLMKKGLGVGLLIVGGDLMIKALNEAKVNTANYTVGSTVDPEYGFKRERVTISAGNRKVHVIYDPTMDLVDAAAGTKHVYGLDPSTWTIGIPSDRNFTTSEVIDLKRASEGGDERDAWHKEVDIMLACEVPSANVIYNDVV